MFCVSKFSMYNALYFFIFYLLAINFVILFSTLTTAEVTDSHPPSYEALRFLFPLQTAKRERTNDRIS